MPCISAGLFPSMFTDTLQISVETVQRISSSKENVGNGKANQLLLPERVWNKYYECGGWGWLREINFRIECDSQQSRRENIKKRRFS